jgi:hypothetical protein
MSKKLPVTGEQEGLGAPTIMDRALAARHGVPYVRLAAFAIDLDRAYGHDPDPDARPLGWEVFVTECYVVGRVDAEGETGRALLEDICTQVLDQPPDAQALGSQVVFAIYHALSRSRLPESLQPIFKRWRRRPRQLMASLDELWEERAEALPALAELCLDLDLDPPLSPPVRNALDQMALGDWVV